MTVGLNLVPRAAHACRCAPASSDASAAEFADLVFVGTLSGQDADGGTGWQTLDFEVSAAYKGEVAQRQRIVSFGSDGCGYEPVGEGPHLVFATRQLLADDPARPFLSESPCSPSRAVAAGAPDPALGAPGDPIPIGSVPVAAVIVIAIAGGVLGVYAAPRLRRIVR